MRIDELKRIAKENGYVYSRPLKDFKFENKDNDHRISINSEFKDRLWVSNTNWCDDEVFNMIKAAVEFAETPIEDREEEKKFYAKHRYLVQAGDYTTAFLNYATNNDRLYVYTKAQTYSVKTQFTLKEIEEIKIKFDTDLTDFELVEVKDVD